MKSLTSYHLGKQILVEQCERISVSSYLRKAKEKLAATLVAAEIKASGRSIELASSKTAFGGTRLWFKCPLCSLRAGMLFEHPLTREIGCRKCLELEYRSRSNKRALVFNSKNQE